MLRSGDATGLQHLLEDYGGVVRERLRKRFHGVLDDSELDEAMNQAAFQVWRSSATYKPELGTLRAWFGVIANNCGLKLLAQRKRAGLHLRDDLDQHANPQPAVAASSSARARLLVDTMTCLERLPPLQRAILEADLAAGGQAKGTDLVASLGTSANSIYVSRLKGLRKLRDLLARMGHRITAAAAERPRAAPTELGAESG
ncbi:MAG: hypothetical protein WAT39_06095 [Planctomycetota bacterium]